MPLYEYECKKCKHRFERIQSFSDRSVKKCPKCGGAVERLLSAPAVQFKGTGWYVTDYARKSSPGGKSASEGSSGDSSDSGEKSSKSEKDRSEAKADEAKTDKDKGETKAKSDAKKPSKKQS